MARNMYVICSKSLPCGCGHSSLPEKEDYLGLQASEFKESMPRKLYLWTDDRSSSNFEEDVARTNNRRLLEERRKLARMIWRFVNGEIPSWIYMLKGG
jgi:hypothetical protein